jgi:hypothetical protein
LANAPVAEFFNRSIDGSVLALVSSERLLRAELAHGQVICRHPPVPISIEAGAGTQIRRIEPK